MNFRHIAILGLGLIGSSLARALKEAHPDLEITGYDPLPDAGQSGKAQGWLDDIATSPATAVKQADLIILAAPIRQLRGLMAQIAPHLSPGAVISDISSVKGYIAKEIAPLAPAGTTFIPAHPIAGKATSGHSEGDAELFRNRRCILTAEHAPLTALWESIGAKVEVMTPDQHDLIYAHLSHLPQLVAYAATETLAAQSLPNPLPDNLHHFLRLGGSPPALWTDIFLTNHTALLAALDVLLHVADHIRGELGKDGESQRSPEAAATLFPRLAASSLVTTVSIFEQKFSISIARYAGSGFADTAAPALSEPEQDIERISQHHAQMSELLAVFLTHARELRELIGRGDATTLETRLTKMQKKHKQLIS